MTSDHDDLRQQAAANAGLPESAARRLRGDTAEELAADANELAALMPQKPEDHNDLIRRLLADTRARNDQRLARIFQTPEGDDQ